MKNLPIFFFVLSIVSCKPEFDKISWETDLTSPVVYTELNIQDLIKDSIISFDTTSDQILTFIYQKELIDVNFDSLVNLNSASTSKNVRLETIEFADQTITYGISMGEVIAQAGELAQFLVPDQSNSPIPAYSGLLNQTLPVDANNIFEEMTLSEGMLDIIIENGLQTDLSNLNLILRNEGSTDFLAVVNTPLIAANQTETFNFSLDGKTINGNLEVEIVSADIVGTNGIPVPIDYSDALITNIVIRDIVLLEGLAIFPEQELFDEDTTIAFSLVETELTKITVETGGVEILGASTIQDTIHVEYFIPSATKDGQIFKLFFDLPPAEVGGSTSITEFFDFSGYELDLTGKDNDTINTIYTQSRGWIDSSGVLTHISLEDSLFITVKVKDVVPSSAIGYLGRDTIEETQSVEVELFQDLEGTFDLNQVEVSLMTENFIGANGKINIRELSAIRDNQSISLESNNLNNFFLINPGVQTNQAETPVTSTTSQILFTESNSNIDQLVELKPTEFDIDVEVIINPDQNNEPGFLYKGFGVTNELQLKIPLNISANNLHLTDTSDVNFSIPEGITSGTFILIAENSYPLETNLDIMLLDQAGLEIDELSTNSQIQAGEINSDGMVIQSKKTVINIPFDNTNGEINNTKKIAFKGSFNTKPEDQTVNIYNNYDLKLKLVINTSYGIGQ